MIINRFAVLAAVLTSLLMLSTTYAATKYYKWTDDAGVIHYGETPPDPGKAEQINVHAGKARDPDKQKADAAMAAGNGAKPADDESDAKKENDKIVKENCSIYKQNLSALQNSARIREKDAKGEYRYLTEEEKQARIKDAESYIKDNCKP